MDVNQTLLEMEEIAQQKRHELQQWEQMVEQFRSSVLSLQAPGGYAPASGGLISYRGMSIADAAAAAMQAKGGPMQTRELADLLHARGVQTNSKNFAATVHAVLSAQSGKFRRTKNKMWELVG